ncbi:MAG: metallophosphoesterase family protein [Gluconacetobacter diazotrophicus]|nr:metallophosphoesterase family protein [Gluconacetobacter diazotrophicus]
MAARPIVLGLVSDTHGLLRPEILDVLRGSDRIVHAGDVGDPAILEALARLAPLTVVRGNVDEGDWADRLPATATIEAGPGMRLLVIHDLGALEGDPAAAGFGAVVHGHSHRPGSFRKHGVLYVNPGSAGPRRFSLPISAGRLVVAGDALSVELVPIEAAPIRRRNRSSA